MAKKKKKGSKPKYRQTGRSNKEYDKRIKAKKPGKRKSSEGGKYYEYRKNRSDMPKSLTGVKYDNQYKEGINLGNKNFAELMKIKEGARLHYLSANGKIIWKKTAKTIKSNPKPYFVRAGYLFVLFYDIPLNKFLYAKWTKKIDL